MEDKINSFNKHAVGCVDVVTSSETGTALRWRDLEPIAQQAEWDCGIACVETILQLTKLRMESRSKLLKLVGTRSIWTIDLVFLLYSLGVHDIALWTTCPGIDPMYADWSFYKQAVLADGARVKTRFEEAMRLGVPIRIALLPTSAFIPAKYSQRLVETKLSTKTVSPPTGMGVKGKELIWIVLVDQRRLMYRPCTKQRWWDTLWDRLGSLRSIAGRLQPSGYRGHYIVIVDYCPMTDSFIVLDPAHPVRGLHLRRQILNDARLAPGTDADTIMVPLPTPLASPNSKT
jgi:hypothetical protein